MDGSFAGVAQHSRVDREGETAVARHCPPTVHNEQSSCRDIASLYATGPDYGSAGRPPHIFGVPGPPAPILAPVSLMSEKSKRNLVKPRSRPFRSGWSPPSAGLSGSRALAAPRSALADAFGPRSAARLSATSGLGRWFLPRARTRVSDGKLDLSESWQVVLAGVACTQYCGG